MRKKVPVLPASTWARPLMGLKFREQDWSMQVVLIDPRIFVVIIAKPANQILTHSIAHTSLKDLLYVVFLFTFEFDANNEIIMISEFMDSQAMKEFGEKLNPSK